MNISPKISSVSASKQLTSPIAQIILLVLFIGLFSWFVLLPQFSTMKQNRKLKQLAEEKLSSIEQQKKNLNQLVSQVQNSGGEIALLDEALPLESRATKDQLLFESLAKSAGMIVASVNSDTSNELIVAGDKTLLQNPYGSKRELVMTNYTMALTGTTDQFKNFLQQIETSGRLLDVASVEISGNEPVTKFRIKIDTYSYQPKQ